MSVGVRAAAFALIIALPLILHADVPESWLEDVISSADGESPLLESLETEAMPFLIPVSAPAGSRERLRFQSSLLWTKPAYKSIGWSDTWARTRVTTSTRKRLRTDLLIVRRVQDPQLIDELHLTVAGRHDRSDVGFTLGTFQFDWGHGLLFSSAFGAARCFSFFQSSAIADAKSVVPRASSREGNWMRGVALQKDIGKIRGTVFGNFREWNGRTKSDPATLTGLLVPTTSGGLEVRDKIEERSAGASAMWENEYAGVGILAQSQRFSPGIEAVGKDLYSASVFCSGKWRSVKASGEAARSGDESAWSAILSKGTDRWRGAFYAMYADPDFFAPRGQGVFSFGEPFSNARILGVRLGARRGRHDVSMDFRSNRTPAATATVSPVRRSDEAIFGWNFDAAGNVSINSRAHFSTRNEVRDGTTVDTRTQALRIEPSWTRVLVWSLRSELRRQNVNSEGSATSGSYLHVQAARKDGKIRPGLRVATFTLDGVDSPLLIYEPNVAGAYPLETVSGNGIRTSAWLNASFGSFDVRAKVAHMRCERSSEVSEFAVAIVYRR